MRELEREIPEIEAATLPDSARLTIVGAGKLGGSLAAASRDAGLEVSLAGREEVAERSAGADAVLLCVPDAEIAAACELAAAADPPPAFVGHTSGATTLDPLAAAGARGIPSFSLHPVQTFPDEHTSPQGAPCGISGSDESALALARELAERLGMKPLEIPEHHRAAYHAAAAMASNYLVVLEESAAELLERIGVEEARSLLSPLVLNTAANWTERGADALTGPVARGDEQTVERHREAIEDVSPELSKLYEVLAERAAEIARETAEK